LIVGNKSDQIEKRKVSFEEGYEFAKTHKLEFTEVSALNAANIAAGFEILAKKILKRLNTTPQSVNRLPQRLENKKQESTGSSCC
jgi:DNA-binding MarR family transcriptional regulator